MAAKKYTDNRTDAEFFADYISNNPPYTPEVYAYAIDAALQAKAASHGIELINLSLEDVISATSSSKKGFSVGVGKERDQTSLWVKQHPAVSKDVTRNGKVVGSYEVAPMSATANTFTHGGFSDGNNLDVGSYLSEANSAVGKAYSNKQTPEQLAAHLAEQKAVTEANELRRQELDAVKDVGIQLTDTLKTYTTALLQAEYQGLVGLNELKDIKPSDLYYPQKKHKGQSDDFINRTYSSAVAMPENYNLLNVGDPTLHPSVTVLGDADRIDIELQVNEVLKNHLHTTVAHLKVVDFKTSLDDDPHPLIGEYEEKYGAIRDLTTAEMNRVNLLEGKLPPVPENEKVFDADGKEIKPEFKFDEKNIFVGGIRIEDLGTPDPKITSGQVFYADSKRSPKNTNITGIVNVVGGDPTKPADEIYLAEGAATAAAMQELIDNAAKLDPEKYAGKNILVLSAYNSNNFIESAKALHHQHPNTPLNAIGDNDIKVMLQSGSRRPLLDNDGEFIYLARNNKSTIAAKDLPADQEEQRLALKTNAGADACHELNKYFVENPNRNAEGERIAPMAAAFIVNKGQGGLNSFILKQQSPNLDNATPENQRLLNPKVDLNDIVENTKNLLRHRLKHNDTALVKEGKPRVDNETKLKSLADLESTLQRVLIDSPAENMRQSLQAQFFTKLDLNEYDKPAAPAVDSTSTAAKNEGVSVSAPALSSPEAADVRPTEIADSSAAYKPESKASSYASKYGSGFMIPDAPAPQPANENKLDNTAEVQKQNVQASSPRP